MRTANLLQARLFGVFATLPLLTVGALLMVTTAACGGGGQVVKEAPPPKVEEKPAEPVAFDAFRDFGGQRIDPGVKHRLRTKPIGINQLEVVVELVKTEWTTRELPDGKEVKDGTADLLIKKGEKSRRVRLDEGEARVIYGAKIKVEGAGEEYDKSRLDYMPWVDIVVTKG